MRPWLMLLMETWELAKALGTKLGKSIICSYWWTEPYKNSHFPLLRKRLDRTQSTPQNHGDWKGIHVLSKIEAILGIHVKFPGVLFAQCVDFRWFVESVGPDGFMAVHKIFAAVTSWPWLFRGPPGDIPYYPGYLGILISQFKNRYEPINMPWNVITFTTHRIHVNVWYSSLHFTIKNNHSM